MKGLLSGLIALLLTFGGGYFYGKYVEREAQQVEVDRLNTEAGGCLEEFKYYLVRHIGLDGDEHGPMATQLLRSLCGDDHALWEVAGRTAEECLQARLELWDGIHSAIRQSRTTH